MQIEHLVKDLIQRDPYLAPYATDIRRRLLQIAQTEIDLKPADVSLADFASGHEYYGLHAQGQEWIFREWAPNATAVFLVGEMTAWEEKQPFALQRVNANGDWELRLPYEALRHGEVYRLRLYWPGGSGDRIPAYARRVLQDPETLIFNAQIWQPPEPYRWRTTALGPTSDPPFIYEVHVGMSQAEEKIGSFREFKENILPRILAAGYNTLQLMALQEHPYYASFGYQVSSFFAATSRFGTPEDLKALIDEAHGAGLRVIMDLIHSHSVSNEVEGLSRFDGTLFQYFHEGPRGRHTAWDSRCFDYGKPQVLHFLLSNCRYWLDEYRLDGFRFDGVTSMLYLHHGLNCAFTTYENYFDQTVDEEALTYLGLANRLVHGLNPHAITIAEDVSGFPGLAVPAERGGIGFDFRFAMGVPDYWIRLTKDMRDEDWDTGHLWYELTNRRSDEKTISYVESHDQALVGDQTIIFRLIGAAMYDNMRIGNDTLIVDRGIALHKMIRLVTLATAGHGYLNFMGNEFGHPEWIDFPRRENNWSYRYARRQWHLADDPHLKYRYLARFDRGMIDLAFKYRLLAHQDLRLRCEHNGDKVLAFSRAGLVFVFNFHPTQSFIDYMIEVDPGCYRLVFDSDGPEVGGHGRLLGAREHVFESLVPNAEGRYNITPYLPSRTGIVLRRVEAGDQRQRKARS
jgi:1,4-alpha-glucan branching enzyme